jgi:hypothetical protein
MSEAAVRTGRTPAAAGIFIPWFIGVVVVMDIYG